MYLYYFLAHGLLCSPVLRGKRRRDAIVSFPLGKLKSPRVRFLINKPWNLIQYCLRFHNSSSLITSPVLKEASGQGAFGGNISSWRGRVFPGEAS